MITKIPTKGEVAIYRTKDKKIRLEVKLERESVWLSQKQMADLFRKDVRTINEHIQNVFKEKELNKSSVIRKFRITAADGKSYETKHLMDMLCTRALKKRRPIFFILLSKIIRLWMGISELPLRYSCGF